MRPGRSIQRERNSLKVWVNEKRNSGHQHPGINTQRALKKNYNKKSSYLIRVKNWKKKAIGGDQLPEEAFS